MTQSRYIHDKLAFNYRMTNIQAGFLYDQLNDLDHILEKKNSLFNNYDLKLKELINNKIIKKLSTENNTISAKWMYCILIKDLEYNNFEIYMNNKLIQIRPFFMMLENINIY